MILFPEFHSRYGPWAVVAGASEGLGQAYANVLGERGLNLVTLARRQDALEEDAQLLRRRHRIEVRPVAMDLGAPDLAAGFEQAIAGLDIGMLVYNAAFSPLGEFHDVALEDHLKTIDVNCRGPVLLSRLLAPRLIARGRGGIILMSSMSGFQGSALISTYAATKAFDTTLAESLWVELAPRGVDVLGCVAGAISTPRYNRVTPADKRGKAYPMRPDAVVREALEALGRKPSHIAGRINRFGKLFTGLMTRKRAVQFFSSVTRDMYKDTRVSQ